MTYVQFLGCVLAPLCATTTGALWWRSRRITDDVRRTWRPALTTVMLMPVVAIVYTTPWDGWLINNRVWWYSPGSVVSTLFGIPFEEYVFMAGQPLITGMWTIAVVRWSRVTRRDQILRRADRWTAGGLWLVLALCGAVLAVAVPPARYLGSTIAWFGLPLALQYFVGADVLFGQRANLVRGMSVTPALWLADGVAISAGAWHIGEEFTTGLTLIGLPVEEALFFLCTNLLVVNSVLLAASPVVRERVRLRQLPAEVRR